MPNISWNSSSSLDIPSTIFGIKLISKPIDNFASNITDSIYNATGRSKYINIKLDQLNQSKSTAKNLKNSKIQIAGIEREVDEYYLEEARKIMGDISLEDVRKINKPTKAISANVY